MTTHVSDTSWFKQVSVKQLVDDIFTKPPRDMCFYKVNLRGLSTSDKSEYNVRMFPYLMDIFISGARVLFGESITPQVMTTDQFELLKKYMMSIGQKVMHRYDNNPDGTVLINIWFEPINVAIDCRGRTMVV